MSWVASAAQTLLAQVKYLTAPLLTLGHLSLTELEEDGLTHPKLMAAITLTPQNNFLASCQRIHTQLVKRRGLPAVAFATFLSKRGGDLFSADVISPVMLQGGTITALVFDSSSLSSLKVASVFFIFPFPVFNCRIPVALEKLSGGLMRREEGRCSVILGLQRRSSSSQLRRRT